MGCAEGTYNVDRSGVSRGVGDVSKLVRGRTRGSRDDDGRKCGCAEESEQHRLCREGGVERQEREVVLALPRQN